MSEDADSYSNWWKKDRDGSLGRKKTQAAAASGVKAGDTFLVVTEGTVTEPIYFEHFRAAMEMSRVWIKVVPGKTSDPRRVIETAKAIADEQVRREKRAELGVREPAKYDHVWAVIDTDAAVRGDFWSVVQQLAAKHRVKLAHSTPCFEFWLRLHFGYTTQTLADGATAKNALRQALGREYSTNEGTTRKAIASFIEKWPDAIIHAEAVRRHHQTAATPSPANPSTEVDHLVRSLNDSAPEHLRKLK